MYIALSTPTIISGVLSASRSAFMRLVIVALNFWFHPPESASSEANMVDEASISDKTKIRSLYLDILIS